MDSGNSKALTLPLKGTTRGLSGVFLPLVMNPLCSLKYYDRYNTLLWGESFRGLCNAAGPLDVPLNMLKASWLFTGCIVQF